MSFSSVKIIVEKTGEEYNTLKDFGLYLTNDDYIGDPVQETNYIVIPGRNKKIDLSEAVTGRVTYTHRPLKIELGGNKPRKSWNGVLSNLRNKIDGQVCRFIFDNDKAYFWRGRVHIVDFALNLSIGNFTIDVPEAEPYKYSLQSSTEPWLWDPFDFETGVISFVGAIHVDGQYILDIPSGFMGVSPEFVVSNLTTLSVEHKGIVYDLKYGTNRIPPIIVNGDEETSLIFTGNGDVEVVYRSGSL